MKLQEKRSNKISTESFEIMGSSIDDHRLESKVALVTGSSRGIGRAIALSMAAAGADVAVHYVSQMQNANEVSIQIKEFGKRSIVVKGDVASKSDVDNIVEKINRDLGPIDILVNNAAAHLAGVPFWETKESDWDRLFAVNVKGQLFTAQAVASSMIDRRSGVILNLSSLGSSATLPGYSAYTSSKGAVEAMTRAMAVELAPYNVRVNALSPGHIDTPENVSDITETPEREKRYQDRIALGRLGTMGEIGRTAVSLVSEDSSYITGQVIQADGGINIWQGPIR